MSEYFIEDLYEIDRVMHVFEKISGSENASAFADSAVFKTLMAIIAIAFKSTRFESIVIFPCDALQKRRVHSYHGLYLLPRAVFVKKLSFLSSERRKANFSDNTLNRNSFTSTLLCCRAQKPYKVFSLTSSCHFLSPPTQSVSPTFATQEFSTTGPERKPFGVTRDNGKQ